MNTYLSRILFAASFAAVSSLHAGLVSFAPTTAGLYNTGVGVAPGDDDDYWMVGASPAVAAVYVHNNWIPSDATSQWIWKEAPAPSATGYANKETITLQLSFNLPASYDHTSTVVTGLWATDNIAKMFLNGKLVAEHAVSTFSGVGKAFDPGVNGFTLSSDFEAGANLLSVELVNLPGDDTWERNPAGLNLRFLTLETAVIPEPSVLLGAMTSGVLGLLFLRRRR